MKITILKEVTDWGEYKVANGTYHIDSAGKMVAYEPPGGELRYFINPLPFSKTKRKFEKVKTYNLPSNAKG